MIGKPYSGKPNVRFDEGKLEIELLATTPALYSTASVIQNLTLRCMLLRILPFKVKNNWSGIYLSNPKSRIILPPITNSFSSWVTSPSSKA
jgi:hypothetical protein